MSNRNKVNKHLINDLRVQLKYLALRTKPSYLWEISFGDCDHLLNVCNRWNIHLTGLQVIQINDMLFITNMELLLRHLNELLEDSFDAFIDVSPDLKSPQLLSAQQIQEKKSLIRNLFNELYLNSMKNKIKIQSIDESMSDMCLICGSLLGYPVIYCNNSPQNGNCLSFEHLSHFCVENECKQSIYSFSCPQIYSQLFDTRIHLWFELIKRQSFGQMLALKQTIKTLPFVLT